MNLKRMIPFFLLFASFLFVQNYFFSSRQSEEVDEKTPPREHTENTSKKSELLLISQKDAELSTPYALENNLMQVIFHAPTGSIREINLKFKDSSKSPSVVLPVEMDREIAKDAPKNNFYPLVAAHIVGPHGKTMLEPKEGGFMPLLRRNLQGEQYQGGIVEKDYAFTLLSNGKPIRGFHVTEFSQNSIAFSNGSITKTFTLKDSEDTPYIMDMKITSNQAMDGVWINSGLLEAELVSGNYTPVLQYLSKEGKLSSLKLPKKGGETSSKPFSILWTNNSNGFFGIIQNPLPSFPTQMHANFVPGEEVPSRITLVDAQYNVYPAASYPGYMSITELSGQTDLQLRCFIGPLDRTILQKVDQFYEKNQQQNPQFIKARTVTGFFSFISEPFAKFCFLLMKFFHWITRSWGISIILLTIAVRIMLHPLNTWSTKSMLKMQALKPKTDAITKKYKNDRQRLMMEQHMLYKSEGVNPFSGCLPLIIQLPFLIGMFELLKTSFELRGVPFIPGWISNLSAPDILFSWDYYIPFIGTSFHLLPFILAILTYFQQKMMQNRADPKSITEEQKQMQSMMGFMPMILLVLFYKMPSGLNIYWIFTTAFGIIQQEIIQRKMKMMKLKK